MKEIITIPDIHGRTFWKIVENDKSDSTIVFLGDYLDPYPHEKITFEDALVNFEEIIDFAKDRKNVVLLVGNHDYHYYFRTGNLGWSRYNPKFASDVYTLFQDNKNLFTIAYQVENTLFTHAGVDSDWYKNCVENREGNVATDQLTFYSVVEFSKDGEKFKKEFDNCKNLSDAYEQVRKYVEKVCK